MKTPHESLRPVEGVKTASKERAPHLESSGLRLTKTQVLASCLVVMFVAVFTWLHLRADFREALADWKARQSGIAEYQVNMVSNWLSERRADAQLVATRPSVRTLLGAHYSPNRGEGAYPGDLHELRSFLDEMTRVHSYSAVYVLDREARVVAESNGSGSLDAPLLETLRDVTQGEAMRIDLLGGMAQESRIAFTAPIFPGSPMGSAHQTPPQPLGVALLLSSSAKMLFPLVTRESVPTRSGETILVRREGNEVIYFSPLRYVPAGSPNLRFSLNAAPIPAGLALGGGETFAEGDDYRGVPVLAAVRRIPETGWGLIRKIDRSEALASSYGRAWLEAPMALLLVMSAGILLWGQRRRAAMLFLKQEVARQREVLSLQAAVADSEKRMRELVESLDAIVWEAEAKNFQFTFVSKRAKEILGYPIDKWLTEPSFFFDHIHPDDREKVYAHFRSAAATDDDKTLTYRMVAAPGHEVWLRNKLRGVRNADGLICRLHGLMLDITGRKRAEDALRRSEGSLAEAQRIAHVGSWESDVATDCLQWSDEVYRIFGLAKGEFDGTNEAFFRLVHPDDRERVREASQNALAGRGPYDLEHRILRPDGSIRYVHENAEIVLDGSGKALRMIGAIHDISEHKQAREALEEAAKRFKLVNLATQDAIFDWDLNAGAVWRNENYQHLFGLPEASPAGEVLWSDRLHPEDRHRALAIEETALASEISSFTMEYRLRCPDGSFASVVQRSHIVRDSTGRPIRMIGALTDITGRKRIENALRESEEKFRKAFMTGADAYYIATLKEGKIVEANDRFREVFGYSREEVIGKTSLQLGLFANPADRQKLVSEIRSKGYARDLELKGRRKDGAVVTVLISANVLEGSNEQMTLGVVRDITEQKTAEQALVRLRQAMDASGEVIFMTDCEGVITLTNPEFTRLYGYTPEEVVGKKSPRILKSGSMSEDWYATFWRTIMQKQVAKGEFVNKTKDGRLVCVESSANPVLDEHGEITGFLAIQRDVTSRKHLEEQFLQAQKMEAVGRLAGGVAHDFNNLLTIINGYSQLLKEGLETHHSLSPYIDEILKAGDRASVLTRQLLAFSRRQVLAPKILDLNQVVANVEKMLRRLIGEDIELCTVLSPDLWHVQADPGQVEQVLMNLVINSRDAMPQGGKLTIETANIQLDELYALGHAGVTSGPHAVLTVSDSGMGMDAETKSHIFEPFFTTKEQGKGTGLGLATVYGIVKQTGGHIWVYSELGKGTTFKVYFPRVEGEVEVDVGRRERREVRGGTETILIVEDEDAVRKLAMSVLESHGYRILAASGPEEANLICQKHSEPIHLLLTDVVMPQWSGRNLAEYLKFLRPEMKILYMSGYTDDTVVRHGVIREGMPFLQKPFTPEALLRRVRGLLDA